MPPSVTTPAARRFAVGVLLAACSVLVATCRVDKLVSPPVDGVLVPARPAVADSAPTASTALRTTKIALGTSRPGSLSWRAERARNSSWIGFIRATGNAPDTLAVQLNPAGLDTGTYLDTIVVSTNNSEAPPVRLPVTFSVHACRVTAVPFDTVVTAPLDGAECGSPRAPGMFARLFGFAGTAGDSVTLELQATGFDARLVLDTTAGGGTPPLAEATACRGAAGDPCITYFRLPVTADYVVEVNGATPASPGTFVLNVAVPSAPDAPAGPGQFVATDSVTPINIGALLSAQSVVFGATLSDADAVDTLRLEVELRRVGVAFTGTPTHTSGLVPNGGIAKVVAAVADDSSYHWRARVADQTGRRGPWVSFGANAESAADFTTNVPQVPSAPSALAQLRGSDQTPIAVGGANSTGSVVFRAILSDPDPGDQLRLEVEVQPVGTPFTNTFSSQSTPVSSGATAQVTVSGLLDNTAYRWQARVVDQTSRASAPWTSFGGNTESAADFVVTVPATQLVFTAQPTTAAAGATIVPAVVVTALGADNNTAVSFSDTITVAIGTNPGSPAGVLAGVLKVKAVAGVATFTDLSINRTGVGYTLTATSSAIAGVTATSAAFTITPGPTTNLAFTVQPTNENAGAAITPAVQVTARDAHGNTATSYTGNVTISIGTNPSGGTLTGTPTVAAVAGVATFTNLRIDRVGTGYTLTAAAAGLAGATSAAFNITPAAATRLFFTVEPSNADAGVTITPAVRVTARDAQGNTATGFTGNVTLAILANPGGGTLGGTNTVAAVAGVATFNTLTIDRVGVGYTLSATATGLTADTSAAFTISSAAASRLVFTVQPTSTTAGASIAPAVEVSVRDGLGNPVPTFTGTVTIATGANPGGGALSGTASVAAVAGVATFGDLSINKSGAGYTLVASGTGLTDGTSATFDVAPATPSKLAFTAQPTSSTAGVAIAPAVVVTARDAFDNDAPQFTGNVTIAIGANPSGGVLSGTATVPAVAGVASFTGLSVNRSGIGYTLTAAATGLSGATSSPFDIAPGTATALVFTVQPATTVAGVVIAPAVQVTARDAQGNTATGFTGNVTIAIGTNPGGGTLSGSAAATPVLGVATFANLSINRTGTGYTLSASATGLTSATSAGFNITPGAATQLVFTVQPSNEAAGSILTPAVQVTARDNQGNTATGFSGNVTLAIGTNPGGGTLAGTTTMAAVGGVATFGNLSINRTGTGYTLTAAASGLTGATSAAFNITAAPATLLVFTVQPSNTAAGAAITPAVQVTARDSLGNTATGFNGSVTIAIANNPSGSGVLSGTTTVSATVGVATFPGLSINRVGTGYTLSASAAGAGNAGSSAFNITPGPATQLVFTAQPTADTAGKAITPAVVVTARDAQGNTATGFTGVVTLAIATNPGGGTLSGTPAVAAVAGVATFANLRIDRSGNGYTLGASATSLTGATSAAFNVSPAPAVALFFTTQPSADTAGEAITPAVVVTARDSMGNTATAFTGAVTVALGANPGSATLSGTATVPAVAGVATFTTLSLNRTGTGYTFTASAAGLTGATSTPFTIAPSTPTQLVVTVQPTNTVAGVGIAPAVQVTARDAQGNTATQYTGNVTVAIGTNPSGGALSGTATVAAVAGVAAFPGLSINLVGNGYTLTANAAGLTGATSAAFNITPAGPSQLAFTIQPASAIAGAPIGPVVQVTALDAQGNVAPTFSGNVTLSLAVNPVGATLGGTVTVPAVAGVASFTTLTIDTVANGYSFIAAASGLAAAISSTFNITHAPASQLVFIVQPTSAVAAATIAPPIQVQARDAFGNTATGFTANVSIAIATNPGGGSLSGPATVAAVSGLATFSGLSINRTGNAYTLAASATGLTTGTSTAFNITPGVPTQLAFTVQPSNEASAVAITPIVQVTARDAQGNTATQYTGNVTVAIGTNPGGGVLSGVTTVAAVAGVAAFPGISINLVGNGYTLTAAAASLTGATSSAFNITSAGASLLVFTVQPTTVTAGLAIAPAVQVTARDAQGNTATGFTSDVTIAIGTNPSGGAFRPTATTTVAAVAGIASFNNLRLDRSGTGYTLTAAASGVTGATSSAFNVTPAPAAALAFTAQPTNEVAGVAIAPAVVVTARDSLGNTATTFTGVVTMAIGTNPGGGAFTASATPAVAAVAGVATFTNLRINRTGTGYTLVASDGTGVTSATSAAFNITPAPASALAFTVQPAGASAGASMTPAIQVTARDSLTNTATSFTGNVTLAIGTNPSGGTLSGTATVAAAAGVASFPGMSINLAGNGYTLTAAATGLTGATSSAFNITSGTAATLFFTVQPSNTTAGRAIAPAVQVTARDAQGNTATGFTGAVTIAIGTNPSGGAFRGAGPTTVAAVAGVATFSNLRIDRTGTGYTLTATAASTTGATSAAFNITPAPGVSLAFTTQPTDEVAGAVITPAVVVTARDSLANTATSFTGNVTVAIGVNPGGGTLSGTQAIAAVAGVATFSTLEINRTGNGYTLTAAAAGLTGATSSAFNITPGAAATLAFTVQPANVTAGLAITPAVQVTARDAEGNTATGFTGTVTMAIGTNPGGGAFTGSATTAVAAVAGVATFTNLRINRSGSGYTLIASDGTGVTNATSAAFNVTPAPASVLVFTGQPSATTAGLAITPAVVVTARDSLGNTATSFTGAVTMAIGTNPGGGAFTGSATTAVAAVAGVATFTNLRINRTGTGYTLVASDGTGVTNGTSAAFNVTPAPAVALAFTTQPGTVTAGVAINPAVVVTARDSLANTATSFTGTVTMAIGTNPGGGAFTGSATTAVAAVAGVATFNNLRINRTGTGYTITATDGGGVTGATSTAFNVTPAPASVLVFTAQPSNQTAGVAIAPAIQVTARDSLTNTATGFTGNVSLAINANPGAGTLTGGGPVAAVAGVATFAAASINRTGTGYTLNATATGVTTATSAAFNIAAGPATQLAFTVQPGPATAGATMTPAIQVTARDNQGNTATSFSGNITVAIGTNPGGGTLSGTPTVAAVAGVASFATLSINNAANGYTLTAAATGLTGATSAAFNVAAGAATQLFVTTQPTTTTAGVAISPAVIVTARDDQGNVATGFTANVTMAIGTNPGGGAFTASATTTVAAVAGIATFTNLRINRTGTGYTLTASGGGAGAASSAAFNITPAPASRVAFTTQPGIATAGAAITPPVVVTAQDSLGNTVPTFTSNVIISLVDNPGGSTLSGTNVVAAVAGVAAFNNLRLNRPGTGYTFLASASGLVASTSAAFTVIPGPASTLEFSAQPTSETAGIAITPAVQVTARDTEGNVATGFTGNVTVAIGANPGGSTLGGTATVAAVAGVATFSTLSLNRTGNGYTLTAAAAGTTGATSAAFNITPGAATQLAFTVQPVATTAGAAITPAVQVTARDNQGNTATGFAGNITVAIGTNPSGGVLSGTATVAAAAGVASFPGLSINLAGTGYTFTAAAAGLTGATSTAFTINPGAASLLVFTVQPTGATAGVAIAPAIQVTARDAQGNTATGFSGAVTLAIGANPGGGTLSGVATVAATAGVATFPGLSINRSGNGYTMTATDGGGVTGATSTAFNITPGTASVLIFTTQPSAATAGATISPAVIVTARDNQGNTATTFTGSVTVAIGTNPGGGTLSGTAAVSAAGGVATFSTLSINRSGNGYTLTANATGVTGTTSSAFNITPGTASVLVFSTQPTSATAGAAITPAVVVTAQDNQGNTATSFVGTVTVAIGSNPGGGTLSGVNALAATAGVASFPGLSINRSGNSYTLTAAATGVTGVTSTAFNITPGPASLLIFTQQPSNTTAGQNITPTIQVTARDNQGNTATGFAGNVTLAIGTNPGGGTLSGTATQAATAGVASFPGMSINASGNGYTLNATATGVTGAASAAFNITPGTASVLVFTTQPSAETAGVAITPAVVVTARDNLGNTATAFTGTVTVAIGTNPGGGTLSGPAALAATAGVATFSGLSINAAGNGYTLTAAASGLTGTTSAAFNITPGAASILVFTTQPTSATAGAGITPAVVVTARDNQGNTATAFTGTVTLAIGTNPGGGTLSGTAAVAAAAGVASFPGLSINAAGLGYTLAASAAGVTGATSSAFNITPGTASVLVFTTQPSSETAGVAITPAVVVTARDNQGNTATSFIGTVTVAIGANPGGGTLSGTAAIAATAGVATFSGLSINRTGTGYTLTANATGVTGATSATFNITPGAATVLAFTTQPASATAGAAISPAVIVTARDNQGNTATAFTGTVTVAIGANPGGGTLSGATAVAAAAGIATFPGLSINAAGTGYTLNATATGVTGTTSAAFNITPGAASVLVFTTQPSSETAGIAITPAVVVTARDNQGNTATSFTATVTVAIGTNPGAATLSGTAAIAATAGVATFSGLSINRTGQGYTLNATATGVTGASSVAFDITPGAANVLVFTTQPASATAGVAISPAVVVTARDNQGNTATSFVGTVTVAIGTNPAGGTLSGVNALAATAGVATFSGLSINAAGLGYTLNATAIGVTGAASSAFNITPGAASVLVFTTQPSAETAGVAITPAVVVTARDNQGNTATGFAGTVTVAIGANPGGGTLSGTAAIAATAGVATFSTLSINAAGNGYTLTANATGLTGATSAGFNITPGTATTLVFTTQPTSATAGVGISPAVVVTARDAQGNTATSFVGTVTVAIGTNPGGGTLSGTAALAATAGVATFPGLSINAAGNGYTFTAVATGLTGATSSGFNITPGAASVLVFTTQPTSATAGVAISPAVVVTARDNQGNTATGFTGTVTVAIGANPGAGTLSGVNALAAAAGVATFSGLSINRSGTGYTFTAAAAGVTGATSAAFNITPGAASALVFTTQPGNTTAGAAITPAVVVTARDNQGNTATSFVGTVTVAIGTNPSAGTLSGTAGVAAAAGVASFPGLSINAAGLGYTLTATAAGVTGATSAAFNITPGAATVLVFTTQPTSATAGAAITPAVVVTARDNQGNTATGFTGTVTVAIGANPGSGTLNGTAAVAAAAGVASFPGLSINATGTGYTLTANASGVTGATSAAFNISAGTATVLVFTTQPTSATAGAAITPAIVVTARDGQGNTATSFTGNVTLAIGSNPGAGTLSGTATQAASAGVATFAGMSINRSGTGYTLTATATGPTGATSAAFNITPGTASVLVFTTQPGNTTAGAAITPAVVVTARDNQGNTATGFNGTVTVAIGTNPSAGTLSGTAAVAATAGVAAFPGLSINAAGTGYTLTATATGPTGATSAAFNITPGAASVLVFTTQPGNTTAGAAITPAVVVTARDNQGNTATGFTGTVTVAIGANPGSGTLSGTAAVAATAGVASFPGLSINAAGNGYTFTAAATGVTGATSAAFNITAGTATVLVFTTQPSSATAGAAISPAVVVTARDNQGNTATGFTGTVTVAIGTNPGAGTLSGTASLAATAGVATFPGLSINRTGTGYTLTAAATGVTGATSAAFNITAGAASVLVFTQQPTSSTAGANITPTMQVTARDNQGNTATAFVGTVTLAIGTNPGGGTLSGTAAVAASAGVASFPGMSINAAGIGYTLTASASGVTGGTSAAFNITPGSASVLVFTTQPASATAGVAITPAIVVTARDNQGNTATSFTGNVTLAIATNPGAGTLSGTATQAASAGIATFAGLSINRSGNGYTLSAAASGVTGATSAAFNITPGAANVLVFTTQPTSATAGVAISPAVVVTARDDQGNTATSFVGTVTVAIGTNPGSGTLSGTASLSAVAGIATFSTLSINRSGNGYTLTAAAAGVTGASSAAFDIIPGAANVLAFTTQPVNTTAGAAITPAMVVTARDNQGNTATSFTGNVTLAIGANPGSGTLSGTATQAASAGVASFPGLSINAAGTGYTLNATAAGVTGATSAAFDIAAGGATVLVFTTQPSTVTAGNAIAPAVVVTARDNQGNTATSFTGTVNVAIGANPGGGTLSGSASLAAVAGIATFSTLSINRSSPGYTLTAAATGLTGATSAAFTVNAGAASVLVFTTQPTSATAGVAITPAIVVTARDNQGNTATSFTGNVTLAIGTNPGAGTLSGTATQAAGAGVATFPGMSINRSGTGYTLTAAATGVTGATSASFNITAAAVNAGQSSVSAVPGVITASSGSSASTITVTARDQFGNPVDSATVVISATGTNNAVTQPAAKTNGSGVATGTLSSTFAEAKTVSATANGVLITQSSAVFVQPAGASASQSSVAATTPITASNGTSQSTITVTVRDGFNNPITGAAVTWSATGSGNTLTSASGTTAALGVFNAGRLSSTAAESKTISAVVNPGPSQVVITQTATVVVDPAGVSAATSTVAAGTTTITACATACVVGSTASLITVTARDPFGNVVPGAAIVVSASGTGNAFSPTASGAADGAGVFTAAFSSTEALAKTVSATANAVGVTQTAAVTVVPAAASQLVFTQQPTNATTVTDIAPPVTVAVRDAFGNTVTAFAGSVTMTIENDTGLIPPTTLTGTNPATVVNGVATFANLRLSQAGVGFTLRATAGSLFVISTAFTIL